MRLKNKNYEDALSFWTDNVFPGMKTAIHTISQTLAFLNGVRLNPQKIETLNGLSWRITKRSNTAWYHQVFAFYQVEKVTKK